MTAGRSILMAGVLVTVLVLGFGLKLVRYNDERGFDIASAIPQITASMATVGWELNTEFSVVPSLHPNVASRSTDDTDVREAHHVPFPLLVFQSTACPADMAIAVLSNNPDLVHIAREYLGPKTVFLQKGVCGAKRSNRPGRAHRLLDVSLRFLPLKRRQKPLGYRCWPWRPTRQHFHRAAPRHCEFAACALGARGPTFSRIINLNVF